MRLFLIFIIISFLPVPAIAVGFIDGRINGPLSAKIECTSQLRDKFLGVGELTQKAKFWDLKEDGSFIEKESYLIKSDKVMIYSSYKNYYCVGYMKNYSIGKIYYGFILTSNINLLKNIDSLQNYIGKWEQDDGSLYKFFEITKKDNRFYIQMEVDIDNSIAMFYTNEGYIDFDFKTHRFKVIAFELGTDKLTDCYYSFYSYNSYLAVVDHNQNNEKCVVDQPFNLSGIYKISHNNN